MADPISLAVRVRWLKAAICPHCHNANTPGKNFIELDDRGEANCGYCGHGWKADV